MGRLPAVLQCKYSTFLASEMQRGNAQNEFRNVKKIKKELSHVQIFTIEFSEMISTVLLNYISFFLFSILNLWRKALERFLTA